MEYYIHKDDAQQGPFTLGQLRSMWASGSITAETLYWVEAAPDWSPLRTIIAQLEQPQPLPPPATTQKAYPAPSIPVAQPARRVVGGTTTPLGSAKRILPAFILWFFLGGVGGHRFYVGRAGSALLLSASSLLGFILVCCRHDWPLLGAVILFGVGVRLIIDLVAIVSGTMRDSNDLAVDKWT